VFTIRFVVRLEGGSALAWPKMRKGIFCLTHEPFPDSGIYGSKEAAYADLDHWRTKYACIESAEVIPFGGGLGKDLIDDSTPIASSRKALTTSCS
jgi:hypothetical protein